MNHLYKILISSIFLIFSITVYADRDFSNVSLKSIKLSETIYMLEGVGGFAGGNIAVSVGEDGILIVDDQFSQMSEKIKNELAKLNDSDVNFVLNTHWHGDHTGGNSIFSDDATVIAHDNVRTRLMTDQKNDFRVSPAKPKESWPIITFSQSITIHFNNETIRVMHFPNGHTDGDAVIHFVESNVIHMGDHYFAGMFPFIDLNSKGNAINFARNVGNIIKMIPDDIKIIPGHGPLSTKQELIKYHNMLKQSIAIVEQGITSGKNLEEIQSTELPGEIMLWETGFIKADQWIKFIYKSLN